MLLNIEGHEYKLSEPKVKHLASVSERIDEYASRHGKAPNGVVTTAYFVEVLSGGTLTAETFMDSPVEVFGEVTRKLTPFLAHIG